MKSFMETGPHVFEKSGRQTHTHTQTDVAALYSWLVGWSLTALSTQFRSYRTFKVELYYKY